MILGAAMVKPASNTVQLDATNVASGVTVGNASDYQQQFLISNDGTVTAFFTYAANGATAPVAVAPASGVPANGIPLLAGTVQTFTMTQGAQVSAITKTGATTLYITPCEGL